MNLMVENLTVAFGNARSLSYAIEGVSFAQPKAEWLGLLGKSGSGKTVLARTITGLLTGSPGVIDGGVLFEGRNLLDGLDRYVSRTKLNGVISISKDTLGWSKQARSNIALYAKNKFAYIFQNPVEALNPFVSIEQHMREAFVAGGESKHDIHEKSRELLATLRITAPDKVLRGYRHELSGGMAQRVVVAMALAQRAAYVIADECTSSLDAKAVKSTLDTLRIARDIGGASIMFITHDYSLAASCCDRVIVMAKGRIIS